MLSMTEEGGLVDTIIDKDGIPLRMAIIIRDRCSNLQYFPTVVRNAVVESLFPVFTGPLMQQQSIVEGLFFETASRFLTTIDPNTLTLKESKFLVAYLLDDSVYLCASKSREILVPFFLKSLDKDGAHCLKELLDKLSSSLAGNLFVSKDVESNNQIQILRKLSLVCCLVSPHILQTFWPNIQERVVELLRQSTGILVMYAYFYIRCCLFQLNDQSLRMLVPIVHSHMIEVVQRTIDNVNHDIDCLYELYGVCSFLDMMSLLHPAAFSLFFWGFASGDGNAGGAGGGLFSQLCSKYELEAKVPDEAKLPLVPTIVRPESISELSPFLCGVHLRLHNSSFPLAADEMESLRQRTVIELP